MREASAKRYLETQIRTAGKEQLLLMLLDGAIRFAMQAREKIHEKDIEGTHERLIRAQKIVMELMASLDPSIGQGLYGNLCGLYNFIYLRFVQANLRRDVHLLDEGLRILRMLRDTWGEAVAQMRDKDAVAVGEGGVHLEG